MRGRPIGRYGEDRSIYGSQDDPERRTIHLAVDLYAAAGTPVLAPLPGRIAMIGNDDAAEGFGGIVVLEHESGTPHRFWTVYGHLAPGRPAIGARIETRRADRHSGAVLGEWRLAAAPAFPDPDRALLRPRGGDHRPGGAAPMDALGEHFPGSKPDSRSPDPGGGARGPRSPDAQATARPLDQPGAQSFL